MSGKGCIEVSGVAGGERADSVISKGYVAAGWLEGVLQQRSG